ncbi:MAG: hypothetical protein ACI9F9_002632 [Candidatus Paceibacteria bacterium]|jgi:hypothetical protein
MKVSKFVVLAGLSVAFSATANAQFTVSGGGSMIPNSGTGGDANVNGDGGATWDSVQPGLEATATVAVPVGVTSIDSIEIDGLSHTWVGDLQLTLEDPAGVEHLIFVRPGFQNTSTFGTAGDFLGGTYTFVETGGASLPTSSNGLDIPAGTYNQSFDTGGTVWNSGTNGINNTLMTGITGAAGTWTLHMYDWAGGDSGNFTAWTLNGNGGGGSSNTGASYCAGDGSSVACPCGANGAAGAGCLTTSGTGATLSASGDADVGADTWSIDVTGGPPNKPGIFFQGTNQITVAAGDGVLCSNSNLRYGVNSLDAMGNVTQAGFGANAAMGQSLNYQYWFRDPANPCSGAGFNFTNAWAVTWN